MSILECYLAAEKEKDGKPFTVCDVDTWFYVGVGMLKDDPDALSDEAARLYNLFHNSKDKTERGITLLRLKRLKSNGGIRIIPKTRDRFVKVADWGKE
jgi:hypothetical protein